MKRRLMIARALVHEPRVLILDEPTAGVDIEMRRSMYDFLRETNAEGRTIIMTTHYLEEAELLCRNVAIINQGKIVTRGAIKDLLRDLNSETFLLDTQDEIPAGTAITGYTLRQVEPHCLEVELAKGQDLAPVFAALSQAGVTVVSMRNKENRLERMFVNVLEGAS
jgi:ABC-2 type transport system ATP-binding protein